MSDLLEDLDLTSDSLNVLLIVDFFFFKNLDGYLLRLKDFVNDNS